MGRPAGGQAAGGRCSAITWAALGWKRRRTRAKAVEVHLAVGAGAVTGSSTDLVAESWSAPTSNPIRLESSPTPIGVDATQISPTQWLTTTAAVSPCQVARRY